VIKLSLFVAIVTLTTAQAAPAEWIAYIGTYTRGASKGIYAYRFQPSNGKLTEIGLVAETSNPSFLAAHSNGRFLYAANENPKGMVSAFAIESATGRLKLLNAVSTKGADPCHLELDRTGKWLFAANYTSGSVAVFPVRADGSLGDASDFVQHSGSSVNRERQEGPHAHQAVVTADNRFVMVSDLGAERIFVYRFDAAKGSLTPNTPAFAKLADGSGPRHLAFRPDGRFSYALSELSETVTTFQYDSKGGVFQELQTLSTLPTGVAGAKSAAEVAVHPNGKFLYASNRGHDSIAIYAIDKSKGTLTSQGFVPTQGKTPRNFAIGPAGTFLFAANQDSNNIVVFRIDQKTGGLTPAGSVLSVPAPVSIVFVPTR